MTPLEAFKKFLDAASLYHSVEEKFGSATMFTSTDRVLPADSPHRVEVETVSYTIDGGVGYAGFYSTFTFNLDTGALMSWGSWE